MYISEFWFSLVKCIVILYDGAVQCGTFWPLRRAYNNWPVASDTVHWILQRPLDIGHWPQARTVPNTVCNVLKLSSVIGSGL